VKYAFAKKPQQREKKLNPLLRNTSGFQIRQIHSEYFNHSNKTNRNTTNVPAEGNSSKRPIVFNNFLTTAKLQKIKNII
jgi:hypothetical protein